MELWRIQREALEPGATEEDVLTSVLDAVEDPHAFLAGTARLTEHLDTRIKDEVRFEDGRVLERWTVPVTGPAGDVYGRGWFFRHVTEEKARERAVDELTRRVRDLEARLGARERTDSRAA